MEKNKKDRELEKHFEALRERTEASVPPFEMLWKKASRKKSRMNYRRWLSLAAAAVIALMSWFYFVRVEKDDPAQELAKAKILEWQAPTDVAFLQTDLSITNWKAATDVLLQTNEREKN